MHAKERRLRELAARLELEVHGADEGGIFTLIDHDPPRRMIGTADGLLAWLGVIAQAG
jgi:hypothetical protein